MSDSIQALSARIKANIQTVIVGKDDVCDLLLIALFSGGHVLLEDVPGTGKTLLAKSLAVSAGGSFRRVQFTPDLLPSDVTGIHFFNQKTAEFEFRPGPVFTHILLADEINRATPKTQAGLLECMEERQVTIDGETHALSDPFLVIATQNPLESMGVFPLPEAQLDRFLIKIAMQYPTHAESRAILQRFVTDDPLNALKPVATTEEITAAADELRHIFVHEDIQEYIVSILEATRRSESVSLGVSPRGGLALMRVAQGYAALAGRDHVRPEDVKRAAIPALAHRLQLKTTARLQQNGAEALIEALVAELPVPTEGFSA